MRPVFAPLPREVHRRVDALARRVPHVPVGVTLQREAGGVVQPHLDNRRVARRAVCEDAGRFDVIEDVAVVPQPAAAVVVDAPVHRQVVLEVVVAHTAVRAGRVGVHAAAVLELPARSGLHRVRDRVVLNLHRAHVRALAPAPARADRAVGAVLDVVVLDRGVGHVAGEDRVGGAVLARQVEDVVVADLIPAILQRHRQVNGRAGRAALAHVAQLYRTARAVGERAV